MQYLSRDAMFVVAALALLASTTVAGDKKKVEGEKPKTVVLHLDASKLPPAVLAQLLKAAGGEGKPVKKVVDQKPEPNKVVKTIGLADAVAIAEKHANGKAFRAEYGDNGFVVAVKNEKGVSKIQMDMGGNIAGDKKPTKKQDGEEQPKPNKKKTG